ncbi:hypothetical protein LOD99_13424 [Oopsacas minuta]|uniref:SCD domain-containing protein n=1 Tax=Oopsacas minuta TaxID=111878 RepID=A0AAV7KJE6_9METZ|nr:hypothetical protein LOD99_13424 [Oopsacas minuta]
MLLFKSVKEGKSALTTLASDWLELYVSDNTTGLTELVKFIIESCGCNATLHTAVLTSDRGIVQAIQELTQGFDEDSGDYPLIMSGPLYKRFRNNFSEFIERVMFCCQHGPLYDEMFLPSLLEWLVGLADSQVRAFRHTCTLACLKITTSLSNIAKKSRESLDKTQRQLESEKNKHGSKKSSDRQKTLERSCKEQEQRLIDLEEPMSMLFSSVFVHRYKDIFPDIRALCISELGMWMREYSCLFLQDKYLKYIGWTLYDKVGEVRLRAVESLHFLYEEGTLIPMLQLFTDRFRNRLVSMVMDKDDTVAVQAVKVCKLLLDSELLNTVETEYVCSLVFVENRAVAQAATEFLLAKLFSQDEFQNSLEDLNPTQVAQARVRELLMFYMAYGILEHGAYFVDALWGHTDLLKDWSVMTDLLLELELSQAEESFLIELLTCCAIRAAGGSPPPGRVYKKIIATKERKNISTDRESMTIHICQALPSLLHKFSTDKDKVISLLSIANHFELNLYIVMRLESHYTELLDCVYGIINKHSNADLMNQAVSTLNYLTANDLAIKKTGEVARNKLIDEIVSRFKDFFSAGNYVPIEDPESESGQESEVILTRLKSLYLYFNLTRWGCFTLLLKLLNYCNQHGVYTTPVSSIMYCASLHINWVVASFNKDHLDEAGVKLINEKVPTVLRVLEDSLAYGDDDNVKADSFLILSDLISLLSPNLINHTPTFKHIVITPSIELQDHCTNFVLHYVFSGEGNKDDVVSDQEDIDKQDGDKLELYQKKREVFAAFTRLILYGSFPMVLASRIFVHYIRYYDAFGSMMKLTISKCKEASHVLWSKTILQSLKQLFEEVKDMSTEGQIDKTLAEWSYLKELAKRFNLLTGFELTKIRKIIVSIHLGGIEFVLKRNDATLSPTDDNPSNYPNLEFLDIVQEFSHKLIDEDRYSERGVNFFLGSLLPASYKSRPKLKSWKTLHTFVTTIYKVAAKKVPQTTPADVWSGESGEDFSPTGLPKKQSRGGLRGARGGRGRARGRGRTGMTTLLSPSVTLTSQSEPTEEQDPLALVDPSSSLASHQISSPLISEETASPKLHSPAIQASESDNPEITNWLDDMGNLDSPNMVTSTIEHQRKRNVPSRKRPCYDPPEPMDSETPVAQTRRSKRINLSSNNSSKGSNIEFLHEPDSDGSL